MRAFGTVVLLCVCACQKPAPTSAPTTPKVLTLTVTEDGFVPDRLSVKKGVPVTLEVTRLTEKTCATELLIDGTDINLKLPLNTLARTEWTPRTTGEVKFGCAMDKMVGGVLLVE